MPILNVSQFWRLIETAADVTLPLSRLFSLQRWVSDRRIRFVNLVFTILVLAAFIFIASRSSFPHGAVASGVEGELKSIDDRGVAWSTVYLKLYTATIALLVIVASFCVDVLDLTDKNQHARFAYRDEHATDTMNKRWTAILIVLAYAARVIAFGCVAVIGIQEANLASLIATGSVILQASGTPLQEFGLGSRILTGIRNPLGFWGERMCGVGAADTFLLVLGVTRVLIVTFFLGVFRNIVGVASQHVSPADDQKRQ